MLSMAVSTLSYAACPNLCSGHGLCDNPSSSCSCFDGYTGPSCDDRVCEFREAWSARLDNSNISSSEFADRPLQECSGQGVCDRAAGVCSCYPGFSGIACERTACPSDCNDKGECITMGKLNQFFGIDAPNPS